VLHFFPSRWLLVAARVGHRLPMLVRVESKVPPVLCVIRQSYVRPQALRITYVEEHVSPSFLDDAESCALVRSKPPSGQRPHAWRFPLAPPPAVLDASKVQYNLQVDVYFPMIPNVEGNPIVMFLFPLMENTHRRTPSPPPLPHSCALSICQPSVL
jgi:hypothetical protein